MRTIKFRGKRLDGKGWIRDSYTLIQDGDGTWLHDNDVEKMDEDTLGQFTGLFDKNGKEIYEGDILGANGKIIGWVKGDVRGYCYDVVYINHPTGEKSWSLYSTVVEDFNDKIEVVGNIFDNQELLANHQ